MPTDDELDLKSNDQDETENDVDEDAKEAKRNAKAREAADAEAEEDEENEDSSDDSGEQESGTADSSSSSGTAATGAVAGVVAAVVVLVVAAISNLTVAFHNLEVRGKTIEYGITVNMDYDLSVDPNVDWSNADTGLVLVVSNSKETYTKPLITSDDGTEVTVTPASEDEDNTIYKVEMTFNGTVEGLTEHRPYKVSVIGDEDGETKVYCEEDVKTAGPLTEVRGIEGHCSCTIDGRYHFRLQYTDDNAYYQAFSYRLLDTDGNEFAGAEITDPRTEQIIENVDQLHGRTFVLEITIQSEKPADAEAEAFAESLGDGAQLTVDHGTIVLTQEIEL